MSPDEARKLLEEGNKRYVDGTPKHPHTDIPRRESLTEKQEPFAIILSCADSRVAPELLFDRGLGDLFVIRVAGNIIDDHAAGSIEYAVKYLKTNLIVVLGHESCGAVGASLGNDDPGGHIGSLVKKIKPAVWAAKQMEGDLLKNSIHMNAKMTSEELRELKPILSDAQGLVVTPAYYELTTGKVKFLD